MGFARWERVWEINVRDRHAVQGLEYESAHVRVGEDDDGEHAFDHTGSEELLEGGGGQGDGGCGGCVGIGCSENGGSRVNHGCDSSGGDGGGYGRGGEGGRGRYYRYMKKLRSK